MSIEVKGKVVVITGTFKRSRQELSDALEALGAKVTDSVSGKTHALFAGEKAGSKLAKAKTLGVPVYSEEELAALLAGGTKGKKKQKAWADWEGLATKKDALAAARALVEGDWAGFVAERDLPPLRSLLMRAAEKSGPTEVHRLAGTRLRELGAQVMHPFGHFTPIGSVGLSHDGRYLATGSWTGDDYDRGGTLVIWEVAAGRAVNVLAIEGGVGWPDFARCVQWSPDGRTVGVVFNTNGVGSFDAFGERQEARAAAYVTNGWSRPPGYVWAEDGVRALVACWGDSKIPGTIVRLDRGTVDERSTKWFQDVKHPQLQDELSIGYGASPGWSAEGLLIFATSKFTFAAREQDGSVAWLREVTGRLEWFPDRKRMLIAREGEFEIAATADGRTIGRGRTKLAGYAVRFGAGERFVLYSPGDEETRGGFEVWHGVERVVRKDMALCPGHYSQPDLQPVALAPDGQRVALLTPKREVVVVAVADGKTSAKAGPFDGVMGLYWGAEDAIVAVGPVSIAFVEAGSGKVRGRFALLAEASGERPLETADGRDLAELWRRDPTFAVGDEGARAWCVAFPEGVVVCPEGQRKMVEETVALVVERRWAWPVAWSDVPIVETVAEAAKQMTGPWAKALKKEFAASKATAQPAKAKARETWPPAERGSLDEVFAALLEAFALLGGGWLSHVSEYLREAAEMAAVLGRTDLVEAAIAKMPEEERYAAELVAALGRCAAIVAETEPALAQKWLARAEKVAKGLKPDDGLEKLKITAGLVAGRRATGDERGAEAALKAARGQLEPETNEGQHTSELASALALAGQVDAAIELFAARIDNMSGGWHFTRAPVEAIVRRGGAAAWEKLAKALHAREGVITESSVPATLIGELAVRGEWTAMFAAIAQVDQVWLQGSEMTVVRGLARAGEREAAIAKASARAADKKIGESNQALWLEVLAEIAPEQARERVLAARRKVDITESEEVRAIAAALVRVGALDEAVALCERAEEFVRIDAAASAILVAGDLAFAQRATQKVEPAPAQTDNAARSWARLSAALRRAGDPDKARAYLATACDGLRDPTRKRWVYEAALAVLIEAGDLTGAHEMLARFPRAQRHRPARTLAEACARFGHYRGCAELLRTLPESDLNDRGQAAFISFMNGAHRERTGLSMQVWW